VQFSTIPRPEWVTTLTDAGATIIDYVPENGFTVLASLDRLSSATRDLPVQLLRLQQPFNKITTDARNLTDAFADVAVSILNAPEGDIAKAFLASITIEELRLPDTAGDRSYYRDTVSTAALPTLAGFPAVVWIEPLDAVTTSGEREAHLIAGDTLVTNTSGVLKPALGDYRLWLTQKGVAPAYTNLKIGYLDTGINNSIGANHIDFFSSTGTDLVTVRNYTGHNQGGVNNDCYGHGTMVAGIIAGNAGTTYATQRKDNGTANYFMGMGVAPGIHLVSGRIFNLLTSSPYSTYFFDPEPWTVLYEDLVSLGVPITNNSWNDRSLNTYNQDAQILDKIVRHASSVDPGAQPMSIFFSAGNMDDDPQYPNDPNNYPYIAAPATAKNVVTVGASENFNDSSYTDTNYVFCCTNGTGYSDNGNNIWSRSRHGTTRGDFRIKPDVAAPGTAMEAPRTTNGLACSVPAPPYHAPSVGALLDGDAPVAQEHLWSRGTSFASPGAAAAGALLYQWFKTKTSTAPYPSLLKAIEINLAYDMTGLGHPPQISQGWGKVDLTRAFKTDGRYLWNNQQTLLTPSSPNAVSTAIGIKDTTKLVRVTLVWTDAPGSNTTKELVNDLDLVVTGTNGRYVAGNNYDTTTGRSKVYAAAGTPSYDRKNNVEQVTFLSADIGSPFQIQVNGISITADAINVWNPNPNTPQQDFALFTENVVGQ
jgi:hypothetical protein